jgi:hypothetical protein
VICEVYNGWTLTYDRSRPVTGVWQAERFGVVLSASSLPAIKRIVDRRIRDYPPHGD